MFTDGVRSAIPTIRFCSFDAKGLQDNLADFPDGAGVVGNCSFDGIILVQSAVIYPSILNLNPACKSGYTGSTDSINLSSPLLGLFLWLYRHQRNIRYPKQRSIPVVLIRSFS
jgi:hypothetical protein